MIHNTRWAPIALGLLVSAVLLGRPAPAAAQDGCPCCASQWLCGNVCFYGGATCTVSATNGCELDGICVVGVNEMQKDMKLASADFRQLQTEEGSIMAAPVGDGRYAAWNCIGELVVLAKARPDGTLQMLDINADVDRSRYTYAKVVAALRARSQYARAATDL
ncbi:MAG: hypothetical protein IRY91_08865 [Gemmatimonadaceae bacterium]|nr:hypothetical protein [Gemmatimonadaceae bacterium]